MLEKLLERLHQRDRRALARLITVASRGEHTRELEEALASGPRAAADSAVVAFTGGGGVGKSTLIGKLIGVLRRQGRSVAVLACDPESPRTGGALLGDRVRMACEADDNVFIRSLSAASGNQALAANLAPMIALTKAYGFDCILLETVGAGQGDTAVRDLCDVVVVLVQPETGDELQWEKAGLLEVADVVVVHKAELPGAERVAADLTELLGLPGSRPVKVVRASSSTGQGIEELWSTIAASIPHA